MHLAVECFADYTFFRFPKEDCDLSALKDRHSYSQGEVVKDVLVRGRAEVGLVDEDPNKPHHRKRDETRLVTTGVDLDVRELAGRHLLIVKPDLERCFIKAMKRLGVATVFSTPGEMHESLSRGPRSRKHEDFRRELSELRKASRDRRIPCLVTEIEDALRLLTMAPA